MLQAILYKKPDEQEKTFAFKMVRSFSYNYHQYMGSIKLHWSVVVGKHTIVYVWKGFENNTRAFYEVVTVSESYK